MAFANRQGDQPPNHGIDHAGLQRLRENHFLAQEPVFLLKAFVLGLEALEFFQLAPGVLEGDVFAGLVHSI